MLLLCYVGLFAFCCGTVCCVMLSYVEECCASRAMLSYVKLCPVMLRHAVVCWSVLCFVL